MAIPKILFNKKVLPLKDQESEFLNLVKTGSAFINPLQVNIDKINSLINTELAEITASVIITAPEKVDLEAALDDLINVLEELKVHTDFLSGVTLTTDINTPALINIINIGRSYIYMQVQTSVLDIETPITGVLQFFGSIYNTDTILNTIIEFLPTIVEDIEDTSVTVAEIIALIEDYITQVEQFKAIDYAIYNAAKDYLMDKVYIQSLVSGALDPYIDLLYKTIGTDKLKEAARNVI